MSTSLKYFKFNEGFFYRPWGNYAFIEKFGKNCPRGEKIGEAWLISDREEWQSVVIEGDLIGKNLHEITTCYSKELFGDKGKYPERFPLLLKLIDAHEVLSVQVHPSDQKARELHETDSGKTEMWYILEAKPNSFIYLGLKPNVKKEHFIREIKNGGDIERLMNKIYVKQGEHYLIPAGTVHAIGPGITLAEIQQNSNLTYRLYDWNRVDANGKPRELHLDKGFVSIETFEYQINAKRLVLKHPFGLEKFLCICPYFNAKLWEVESSANIWPENNSFHIILGLDDCQFEIDRVKVIIKRGEAIMIPYCSSHQLVVHKGKLLDYYIMDNIVP